MIRKMNLHALILGLVTYSCTMSDPFIPPVPYSSESVRLHPVARIENSDVSESSALLASSQFENVFWTLNDSGDKAQIFAIDPNGKSIYPSWGDENHGITIGNAVNIDWEDIAQDDAGNLYIGACGNNSNTRRDLAVYVLPEPDPRHTQITRLTETIRFHYPDQTAFPPQMKNFDSEALFWSAGSLYLLTKHRSDTYTKLYQFKDIRPDISNPLTFLSKYDVGDMVTSADARLDGSLLAVLTYTAVWLFEPPQAGSGFFSGKVYRMPIRAQQCEGICLKNEDIWISNEQRELFRISLNDVRRFPVKD